jgi:GT2 family glycosyltransferase
MSAPALRVSVMVPSYRRPELLRRCLEGLAQQTRQADEVLVVRRESDLATAAVVREAPLAVREVLVTGTGGILEALHAGCAAAAGDIVVFTDDDAVPRAGWLARLLHHYEDPDVGGVGGRDVTQPLDGSALRPSSVVGRIGRWGKQHGHHHLGSGPAVDVEVLKGVNMSFRREALALPAGLRGQGAQVHNEVAICLWARAAGWRLRYDPAVLVDHYHGVRFDPDRRHRPAAAAIENEAYNLVVTLLSLRPELTLRRAVYGLLVGDRATPGLVRTAAAASRREREVLRRALPSLRGQLRALTALRRGSPLTMVPLGAERQLGA